MMLGEDLERRLDVICPEKLAILPNATLTRMHF